MSFFNSFKLAPVRKSHSFRPSITLLEKVSSVENGRYVDSVAYHEFSFRESPYSSMQSDEFSLAAIVANGGNPSQVFVSSTDVDSVSQSVNKLNDLIHSQDAQ